MSLDALTPVVENPDPMLPVPYRVVDRRIESHDTVTLRLAPEGAPLAPFLPGQFTMLGRPGIGEIALSISGDATRYDGTLVQTIRDVGAVSQALHRSMPGDLVSARGPFGTSWGLETANGHDLVIVGGGAGMAPLRPVIWHVLARRNAYRRVVLIVGARSPLDLLFADQLDEWAARDDLDVKTTIDEPIRGWTGRVGFVTDPLSRLTLAPLRTIALLCGPEPMMRFAASMLLDKGMRPTSIRVSLERNMKCGVGLCGHCQLGPLLVCRDGPVVDYSVAQHLFNVREL